MESASAKLPLRSDADSRRPMLIYDAQCRLCMTAKEGLQKLGSTENIRYVPYQTDEARSCLGDVYKSGRPDAAFLVMSDGTVRRGLDAFLPLLPGLPGGRFLVRLMRLSLLRPLAYLAYRIVARYRYAWFGQVK